MPRPKSPQGATHLTPVESPRQDLDPVAQHHRHPIAEAIGQSGGIDIDRFDRVAAAIRHGLHDRIRLGAQRTRSTSQEQQVAQCGTVPPVRPGTTIAILMLIALLLIAGVIFVIRLNSLT